MGCPIGLEVAHEAPERVHSLVLVSPAGGVQNQPLPRALGQLALDVVRESPRMVPVALPDYVRFGPVDGLRLFRELTLFPSLERLLHTPVPTLAVLGGRDPLMPSPSRVREVGRLAPPARRGRAGRTGGARGELQPPPGAGRGDRVLAGRRAARRRRSTPCRSARGPAAPRHGVTRAAGRSRRCRPSTSGATARSVECPDGSASRPYRVGMTWPTDQPTSLTGALVTVDEPGPGRVHGPGCRAR